MAISTTTPSTAATPTSGPTGNAVAAELRPRTTGTDSPPAAASATVKTAGCTGAT